MSHLRRWMVCLYLTLSALPHVVAHAQFSYQIAIHSPQAGEAVQGVVPVIGFASVDGFTSYQLEFSLESEDNTSWFLISSSKTAVEDNLLGDWDTTSLTDGNYFLQLTVFRELGPPVVVTVSGLRVRNYSTIETDTPAPVETANPTETSVPVVASPTIAPSPFNANPVVISPVNLKNSAIAGVCLALLILASVGILGIKIPGRSKKRKR